MESINIEGSSTTLHIVLDAYNGEFLFQGRSIPENASQFYQPILDWLDNYAKNPNEETIFVFKIEYLNTPSSKYVLGIFSKLENIHNSSVRWFFEESDEDIEEMGQEYSELVEVPFEFISY